MPTPVARKAIESQLIAENFEYKKLSKQHEDLENQISKLDKQKYLTLEQEKLRKDLQKEKLAGRDRMEKILAKQAQL
jgi:uncharacterized protein YdcH (DUF465 family)